jgi:hypothetical protein
VFDSRHTFNDAAITCVMLEASQQRELAQKRGRLKALIQMHSARRRGNSIFLRAGIKLHF